MVEGVLLLAMLIKEFKFETVEGKVPVPAAHLTVRARDGIYLALTPRSGDHDTNETHTTE